MVSLPTAHISGRWEGRDSLLKRETQSRENAQKTRRVHTLMTPAQLAGGPLHAVLARFGVIRLVMQNQPYQYLRYGVLINHV